MKNNNLKKKKKSDSLNGNKTYTQIYKELCISLNCQINNSVNHAYL